MKLKFIMDVDVSVDGERPGGNVIEEAIIESAMASIPGVIDNDEDDYAVVIESLEINPVNQNSRLIEFPIYRTPAGKPTCSASVECGDCCKFVGYRSFGYVPVCMVDHRDLLREDDYLAPHKECILWEGIKDD